MLLMTSPVLLGTPSFCRQFTVMHSSSTPSCFGGIDSLPGRWEVISTVEHERDKQQHLISSLSLFIVGVYSIISEHNEEGSLAVSFSLVSLSDHDACPFVRPARGSSVIEASTTITWCFICHVQAMFVGIGDSHSILFIRHNGSLVCSTRSKLDTR